MWHYSLLAYQNLNKLLFSATCSRQHCLQVIFLRDFSRLFHSHSNYNEAAAGNLETEETLEE